MTFYAIEETTDEDGIIEEETENEEEVESKTDIDPTETDEEAKEITETEVELLTDYTDGNTEGTILGKQMKKATDGLKKIIDKARN